MPPGVRGLHLPGVRVEFGGAVGTGRDAVDRGYRHASGGDRHAHSVADAVGDAHSAGARLDNQGCRAEWEGER